MDWQMDWQPKSEVGRVHCNFRGKAVIDHEFQGKLIVNTGDSGKYGRENILNGRIVKLIGILLSTANHGWIAKKIVCNFRTYK